MFAGLCSLFSVLLVDQVWLGVATNSTGLSVWLNGSSLIKLDLCFLSETGYDSYDISIYILKICHISVYGPPKYKPLLKIVINVKLSSSQRRKEPNRVEVILNVPQCNVDSLAILKITIFTCLCSSYWSLIVSCEY